METFRARNYVLIYKHMPKNVLNLKTINLIEY